MLNTERIKGVVVDHEQLQRDFHLILGDVGSLRLTREVRSDLEKMYGDQADIRFRWLNHFKRQIPQSWVQDEPVKRYFDIASGYQLWLPCELVNATACHPRFDVVEHAVRVYPFSTDQLAFILLRTDFPIDKRDNDALIKWLTQGKASIPASIEAKFVASRIKEGSPQSAQWRYDSMQSTFMRDLIPSLAELRGENLSNELKGGD